MECYFELQSFAINRFVTSLDDKIFEMMFEEYSNIYKRNRKLLQSNKTSKHHNANHIKQRSDVHIAGGKTVESINVNTKAVSVTKVKREDI